MTENNTSPKMFTKSNLMWMFLGVALIALGMILMAGGKSDDPNTFNPSVVYSKQRITVAPILIMIGLVVEIYAIFKKK